MKMRCLLALLSVLLPGVAMAAVSAGHRMQTGDGLLKMCLGADKVPSLAMMCHNYLNGYIDATLSSGPARRFCLGPGDKERLPTVVVTWLNAHPDYQKKSAPAALDRLMGENYPCRK